MIGRKRIHPTTVGVYLVKQYKDVRRCIDQDRVKLRVIYRNDRGELRVAENIGECGLASLDQYLSAPDCAIDEWYGPLALPEVASTVLDENFLY